MGVSTVHIILHLQGCALLRRSQKRYFNARSICWHTVTASATAESPGIVYATAAGSRHDMPGHAECAARIPAILTALDTSKLSAEHRLSQVDSCYGTAATIQLAWKTVLGTTAQSPLF